MDTYEVTILVGMHVVATNRDDALDIATEAIIRAGMQPYALSADVEIEESNR